MMNHTINHEYVQSNGLQVVLQQLTEANETELVDQIFALSDRPEVLGLLIYKLMMERKQTNELLESINKKYDTIISLQSNALNASNSTNSSSTSRIISEINDIEQLFLTEQDKSILRMAKEKHLTAKDVQDNCNYKGLNAASQRLNKLNREGYLEKQRVGQQVVFVLNAKYKSEI